MIQAMAQRRRCLPRRGTWWADEAGGFYPALAQDTAFDRYAYGRYGLVRIGLSDDQVWLQWDVHRVDDSILSRLVDEVSERRLARANLTFRFHGWVSERRAGMREAIRRVREIQSFRDVPLLRSTVVRQHDAGALGRGDRLLHRGIEAWRAAKGRLASAEIQALASCALVMRPSRDDGPMVFAHIGRSAAIRYYMGNRWAKGAIGGPCGPTNSHQEFESTSSAQYDAVLESGEPRLDHVLGLVVPEDRDPVWALYRRVLLPARAPRGEPALISLSQRDPVDIPFLSDSA